jgi:hypothetical protein
MNEASENTEAETFEATADKEFKQARVQAHRKVKKVNIKREKRNPGNTRLVFRKLTCLLLKLQAKSMRMLMRVAKARPTSWFSNFKL